MRDLSVHRNRRSRRVFRLDQIARFVWAVAVLAGLYGAVSQYGSGKTSDPDSRQSRSDAHGAGGFVGSQTCALCHASIYKSYSQTDMGRSMSEVNGALLARTPTSASVFSQSLGRHLEIHKRNGHLFQSEFELSADGKEVFRDTHRVEWIIGAGANGFGAIVRRGNYLFEAPLSFYSNVGTWALSPGYEFADYGFSRPILPGCIACHSGRPQAVLDGMGRFEEPPFQELAIGCENCHGSGRSHAAAVQTSTTLDTIAASIVNPAKLTPWLADNICMSCHQTGDARVLRSGKRSGDFRPGAPLDDTLSIFLVPLARQTAPQDDLLEHYLLMRFSKCYRGCGGKLGCIRCHDPHVQPSTDRAAAYFREKCLTCHTEKSCAASQALRQETSPSDDCVGCHMPKRKVKVISHSVLTNHRIVIRSGEPFPDEAFQMTTPELPDLVHLSAPANEKNPLVPRLTLLQAYRQVMLSHPEYRERYWAVAKQLEAGEPDNVPVLQALADLALQEKSWDGASKAIRYLREARSHGSTQPADIELLAKLLVATKQEPEAIDVLKQGIESIPYDAELYRLLERAYLSLNRIQEACEAVTKGRQIFPQDTSFRSLSKDCVAPEKRKRVSEQE